ncbi:metal/formaldehyde-sensitive transcriptional repressor [Granulibacter bethesdensis]|nr:metal/formaldehyde-sensitive transcriptional repressor [Granulibacter bethesdensis]
MRSSPDTIPIPSRADEKTRLLKRLKRIRGQVDALHRAVLEQDAPSTRLIQQATACRGAMDGFIAEIIEDHIREQIIDARNARDSSQAAEELIRLVHSYLT